MNSFVAAFLPSGAMLLGLLIVVGPLFLWRWLDRRRGRRTPLTKHLLRSPGESLRQAIENHTDRVQEVLLLGIAGPAGVAGVYLSQSCQVDASAGGKNPVVILVLILVLGAGVALYAGIRLVSMFRTLRSLRLGLDGELATGEELNQLLTEGFRVYHDFPAEGFNIDHVVIGPTGVFAVETKARAKPTTGDGKRDATVVFDGQHLQFPWGAEDHCLEQANRQAQWLQKWLRQAVGEAVPVQPVLALPGWFVDRQGRGAVRVFNPGQTMKLFPKVSGNRLDDKLVTQVAYQVEQRCRNVAPQAYRDAKERSHRRSLWVKPERAEPTGSA